MENIRLGYMPRKIDFSRAFDRMERPYMFQLLRKLRIPEKLIILIKVMYQERNPNFDANGYFTKSKTQLGTSDKAVLCEFFCL